MYATDERGGVVIPEPCLPTDRDEIGALFVAGIEHAMVRVVGRIEEARAGIEPTPFDDFDEEAALEDMRRAMRLGL